MITIEVLSRKCSSTPWPCHSVVWSPTEQSPYQPGLNIYCGIWFSHLQKLLSKPRSGIFHHHDTRPRQNRLVGNKGIHLWRSHQRKRYVCIDNPFLVKLACVHMKFPRIGIPVNRLWHPHRVDDSFCPLITGVLLSSDSEGLYQKICERTQAHL